MDHTALLNRVHPLLTNGNRLSAQSFEALFGTCTRTERVSTQMAGWNDNGRSYGGGGYNNNRNGYSNSYNGNRSGYSNSYNGNRSGSSSYNSRSSYGQQNELPPEITPKKVPEDYVDEAERIMSNLMSQPKKVTTSKIRNLLSLVTDIYNAENIRTEEKLRPESVVKLNLMRVRVAYECGRDNRDDTVKTFVKQTNLLEYLKGISDDRADLIRFAHYMEALVAFHCYFSGKEG